MDVSSLLVGAAIATIAVAVATSAVKIFIEEPILSLLRRNVPPWKPKEDKAQKPDEDKPQDLVPPISDAIERRNKIQDELNRANENLETARRLLGPQPPPVGDEK